MAIADELKKSKIKAFREAWIRRRQKGGGYESSWTEITEYIIEWGTIDWSIDDIQMSKFRQSSLTLVARNDRDQFADELKGNSLFFGYLTRYKTMVRINAGVKDSSGSKLPANNSVFYGLITDEIRLTTDGRAIITINSLMQAFEEIPGVDLVPQLPANPVASDIMTKVRDMTDTAGNYIFREYITATDWSITSTASTYTAITTATVAELGLSVQGMIEKIYEAEPYVGILNSSGQFVFKDKSPATGTSVWSLIGAGMKDSTYGNNIVEIEEFSEGWNKVYQRIEITIDDGTSTVATSQAWAVGDDSSSYKFGQRIYHIQNKWLNTATAGNLANNLLSEYQEPKREMTVLCKWIPHLNLLDSVRVYYLGRPSVSPAAYWGSAIWGVDYWTGRIGGLNIKGDYYRIIGIQLDLEHFATRFRLRLT